MDMYAFAVKISKNEDLFEVFEQVLMTEKTNTDTVNRWKNGFKSGKVTMIKNKNIEKISVGSFWDGQNLIFSDSGKLLEFYSPANCTIVLSDNYVFGALIIPEDIYIKQKFSAALQNEIIGIDITNINTVNLGSIWDGTKFIS